MAGVWRDPKHTALLESLCERKAANTNRPVFKTFIDLIVFSAMIGFSRGRLSPLSERVNEIPQRVFHNQGVDGLIYLIAVMHANSGEMFREKNESDAWQIFEQYANGGLEIISEILAENPNDFDGVSSLLNFIKEEAIAQLSVDPGEVESTSTPV